jgi:hypothetical protein
MTTPPHTAASDCPTASRSREILRLAFIPAALLVAAALAGCGGDKSAPTDPASAVAAADAATTTQISADVASDAGDASATLSETFGASESASGSFASRAPVDGRGLDFSAAPSTACTGPDASGFYTCDKTSENGFTVTRAYRYWSGGALALHYSEATTDSVNHRWTLGGAHVVADTAAGVTRTVRVSRADTSTMQVVRGTTSQHVWNGVGVRNDTASVTDKNGTRSYVVAAADTITAVAYAQPRKNNPWPLSGNVTHNVRTVWTNAKGATTTTTRRAVVTFNGTQTASVQVGALTCALDLKTHRTSGCK